MSDTSTLKPCPFCGGEASIIDNRGRPVCRHYVSCDSCGAQTRGTAFENDEFNTWEWNRRIRD